MSNNLLLRILVGEHNFFEDRNQLGKGLSVLGQQSIVKFDEILASKWSDIMLPFGRLR